MPDHPLPPDDATIPSRKRRLDDVTRFGSDPNLPSSVPEIALPGVDPWALQQYFDGEGDLNADLVARFPQIPVMSSIRAREVGRKTPRGIAMLSTQDGAAGVIVELDVPSLAVQFTYTLSSVFAFRFCPGKLTAADRAQWVATMRREAGEIAFLWDETRWSNDYLIAMTSKNFTNLYAFSPHHIEAAARLTPDVARKLVEWLNGYWQVAAS